VHAGALLTADNGKLSIEVIKPDKLRVSYRDGTVQRSTMVIRAALRSRRPLFFPSAQAGEAARLRIGAFLLLCAAARLGRRGRGRSISATASGCAGWRRRRRSYASGSPTWPGSASVGAIASCTVSRLDLAVGHSNVTVLKRTEIAMGYTVQPNDTALILGPTGLAYEKDTDTLYVASTADNQIFAVPHAGKAVAFVTKGTPIFANPNLRGPLALVFAPNGNLLTSNGDAQNADATHPSEIVEFTKSGQFVRQFNVDASQGGAFGIATVLTGNPRFNFAAVDDVPNIISVYSLPFGQNQNQQ